MKKKILGVVLSIAMVFSVVSAQETDAAKKIMLNKKNISLIAGETFKLKVKNTKANVKWTSTKKSVATVTKIGKVTAKKKGTATIKAKAGKKTLKCKVKVSAAKKTVESAISNGLANLIIPKKEVMDFETVSKGCRKTINNIMTKTEKLKDNYSYKKCQELLRDCRNYIKNMSAGDIKKMYEEYITQLDGPKAFRYKYSILDYVVCTIFFQSQKNLEDEIFKEKLEELFNSVYEIGRIEMHKGVAPCTILYTLDSITRVPEFLDLLEDLMQHFHFTLENTLFDLEASDNPRKYKFETENLMTGYEEYLESERQYEEYKNSFTKTEPKTNTEITSIETKKDPEQTISKTRQEYEEKKRKEEELEQQYNAINSQNDNLLENTENAL